MGLLYKSRTYLAHHELENVVIIIIIIIIPEVASIDFTPC